MTNPTAKAKVVEVRLSVRDAKLVRRALLCGADHVPDFNTTAYLRVDAALALAIKSASEPTLRECFDHAIDMEMERIAKKSASGKAKQ